MDFIPDYDIARKDVYRTVFGTYSSAYIVTNEYLPAAMNCMPKNCENALVVAASGDHPLFCSLSGAKNVDTFDISYNAKCMMDMKVAALNSLNYLEYTRFLTDLYNASLRITNVKHLDTVLSNLNKTERDYIYALKDYPIFARKSVPLYSMSLLKESEYYKLREHITKPYNFIMSDICKLGKKLTKSYDFMHLSNVFDYVRGADYENVILSLMEHVKPGGRIVTQFFVEGNDQIFGFYMAELVKKYKNWGFDKKVINFNEYAYFKNGIYVLERSR